MNDKCLEESFVNWQPPPPACKYVEIPSAHADKLICMIGRLVDKHTHGFIVQVQFGWFISVCSHHLLIYLSSQNLLNSHSTTGTVLGFRYNIDD